MQVLTSIVLDFSKAWWLIIIISFLISFYMSRSFIVDHPNERSLHHTPTPRGGGLAFVVPTSLLFIVISMYQPLMFFLFLPSFLMAIMGFWDDCSSISWKKRFLFQVFFAIWTSAICMFFTDSALAFTLLEKMLLFVFGVLWLIALGNMYNFMDGIDGNAAIEAIGVCLFFSFIALRVQSFEAYSFTYYILFGVATFLVFNFPKARLFMGDVGSQFLGFIFGTLGLLITIINWDYFFVMPLLLFNFIFDASWTILVRFFKGDDIFKAHQTHLYQKLVLRGWQHWQVSLLSGLFVLFQGSILLLGVYYWQLKSWEGLLLFIPVALVQGVYAFYGYCCQK